LHNHGSELATPPTDDKWQWATIGGLMKIAPSFSKLSEVVSFATTCSSSDSLINVIFQLNKRPQLRLLLLRLCNHLFKPFKKETVKLTTISVCMVSLYNYMFLYICWPNGFSRLAVTMAHFGFFGSIIQF
jgi:hypothetical protein